MDIERANVIIRTADNFDFHTQKPGLALFSPVFADILSVPQPENSSDSLPIVPISEDKELFVIFLRCVRSVLFERDYPG